MQGINMVPSMTVNCNADYQNSPKDCPEHDLKLYQYCLSMKPNDDHPTYVTKIRLRWSLNSGENGMSKDVQDKFVQQRSGSSYKTNKRKSYKGSKKYTTRNNKTKRQIGERTSRQRARDATQIHRHVTAAMKCENVNVTCRQWHHIGFRNSCKLKKNIEKKTRRWSEEKEELAKCYMMKKEMSTLCRTFPIDRIVYVRREWYWLRHTDRRTSTSITSQ